MELCGTLLFWTWFVINSFPLQSLWDVWNDLCCNLWAHLRVSVVCWSWNSVAFIEASLEELPGSAKLGHSCLATKISAPGPSSFGWFRHKTGKSSSYIHTGDKSRSGIHFSKICTTYKGGACQLSKVHCEYISKMPLCLWFVRFYLSLVCVMLR